LVRHNVATRISSGRDPSRFLIAGGISGRLEHGTLGARNYAAIFWPAGPGFVLEWLSDSSLQHFLSHYEPEELVWFAVFSCLFLIFVTTATAALRFGIGIKELSAQDYARWRDFIWLGALAIVLCVTLGTAFIILVTGAKEADVRLSILQSWLYKMSLIVYFLLTVKMMLPLIVKRLRVMSGDIDPGV
jgi:hypothetical protein